MKDFAGWFPIRIYRSTSGLTVDWAHLGNLRFTDPFFGQTVGQCLRHPAHLLFRHQTPMSALGELQKLSAGLAPAGFIFHMSRCGSTLLSQMLAALPEHVVISEAGPIDDLLRAPLHDPGLAPDQQVLWLRWLLSALGQRRSEQETRLFIKFDSWHTLFLPLIQRAFPEVPWIFLYRDPVEVLVSHAKQMGSQMIPGALEPALFGWDAQALSQMPWQEYGARVLARICDAALAQARAGRGRLVHYRQLPRVVAPALMKYWSLDCAPEAVRKMNSACQFHAKNPVLPFTDDTQTKAQATTDEIRQIARQWLEPVYRQLQAQRLAQPE